MNRLLAAVFLIVLMCGISIAQRSVPKDTRITLKRGFCLGDCMASVLSISSDGSVQFMAEFIDAEGNLVAMPPVWGDITVEDLKDLVSEFEKIDFFSLKNSYPENCPTSVKNNPPVTTSITIAGKSKQVTRQFGCEVTPVLERLIALENKISRVAGTEKLMKQLPIPKP